MSWIFILVLKSFPSITDAVKKISGSGALQNLGNSGRVANPMANYVSGGNIARGFGSGGGSNLPGVASRLNLRGIICLAILTRRKIAGSLELIVLL